MTDSSLVALIRYRFTLSSNAVYIQNSLIVDTATGAGLLMFLLFFCALMESSRMFAAVQTYTAQSLSPTIPTIFYKRGLTEIRKSSYQ